MQPQATQNIFYLVMTSIRYNYAFTFLRFVKIISIARLEAAIGE